MSRLFTTPHGSWDLDDLEHVPAWVTPRAVESAMARITRFGGWYQHAPNVAAHSYGVAMQAGSTWRGPLSERCAVALLGAWHDVDEPFVGDVPRPARDDAHAQLGLAIRTAILGEWGIARHVTGPMLEHVEAVDREASGWDVAIHEYESRMLDYAHGLAEQPTPCACPLTYQNATGAYRAGSLERFTHACRDVLSGGTCPPGLDAWLGEEATS